MFKSSANWNNDFDATGAQPSLILVLQDYIIIFSINTRNQRLPSRAGAWREAAIQLNVAM
jgi:hypothetical protein